MRKVRRPDPRRTRLGRAPAARWLLIAGAAGAALVLGALAARPSLERAIRSRIEAEAAERGLVARIDTVRVGLWPPLRLTGAAVEKVGTAKTPSWQVTADSIEAWWPGRPRLVVRHAVLRGPAGVTVAAESTTWDVVDTARNDLRVTLGQPQAGLVWSRTVQPDGSRWEAQATDLPVGRLLDVRRSGRPLLDGGTVRGTLTLKMMAGVATFDLDLAARSARLPTLAGDGSEQQALGEPMEMAVKVSGSWRKPEDVLGIPMWSATIYGAALSGALEIRELDTDPSVDLSLDVQRMDFARLLRAAGLESPLQAGGKELGSATLAASARGRIGDPASFVVTQKLEFTPPQPMPPAIARLRGDFVHDISLASGGSRTIEVSPASPDFIALADVPPLFLRALLLGEDAGFYGHPGIDLRELPAAILTDWARRGAARGASTITQQLAKNLFLSQEKRLGRKLQELSLTLLLESALGKARILEIYLNIIEWGPGLYGLRPAARTYFGKEPQDLTPAQMAFLVSLIPGPVKYQSSFAHGTPGPGLRQLVDALLAKLRSVDALSEAEYQSALAEEIVVQGRASVPAADLGAGDDGGALGAQDVR